MQMQMPLPRMARNLLAFFDMYYKISNATGTTTRCGIVLAAGEGKRLRPFVQKLRGDTLPKQYVNFIGRRSMLEHTFHRAHKLVPAERLVTVVSERHLDHVEVRRQLSRQPPGCVIMQPDNRETAPGLLLLLAHLNKLYPDSSVAVFPSDHFILEEDLFLGYVELAFRAVERDPSKLVLLGVEPSDAESEYGYIVPGNDTRSPAGCGTLEVSRFIEKPQPRIARDLVSNRGLWNTLVMVFKARTFIREVRRIAPPLYGSFERISKAIGTPSARAVVKEVYQQLHPVNLSKGLLEVLPLERPSPLLVLPVRGVQWSDWGSETRILHVLRKTGYMSRLCGDREKAFAVARQADHAGGERFFTALNNPRLGRSQL